MDEEITYQVVVERLAPCGIDCERCVMHEAGRVRRHAAALIEALRGFETMAPMVVDRFPSVAYYDKFSEILATFAQASCTGCRNGGCSLPFCAARTCYAEHGVDFCFQCEEYPCLRNDYPENIAARWRAHNDRMGAVGAEQYYQESLERPRYGYETF
jgi:hypothetical protein